MNDATPPIPGAVRLGVWLAPDVAETLRSQAAQKGISVTEAVRRAVAVWAFVEDVIRDGNRVAVVEQAGGREVIREVIVVE